MFECVYKWTFWKTFFEKICALENIFHNKFKDKIRNLGGLGEI
jgi:hypothetical protein